MVVAAGDFVGAQRAAQLEHLDLQREEGAVVGVVHGLDVIVELVAVRAQIPTDMLQPMVELELPCV